jgi:5-formyltetrahydrofolate cyclo-ligase
MTKSAFRKIYRERRQALSTEERAVLSKKMLYLFRQLRLPPLNVVHTYLPITAQGEIDTAPFLECLQERHPQLTVLLPVADFDTGEMEAVRWSANTRFTVNPYQISEPTGGETVDPALIDCIFVPLLCFDTKGHRIGYGKGFYDRFLSRCRPDCLKIGFSFFAPEAEITDTNKMDVPLDKCITPEKIYEF